ncbi:MAG TPA: hypothetical protein VIM81_02275 [Gammaproteobacteria bacterium]
MPVTGEEKWRFDPHADEGGLGLIEQPRQAVRCRSVAYWEAESPRPNTACERRVYKGDINGYLFAIDADTGASCSDFGAAKGHGGYASHWDYAGNGVGPRHTTSGPIVVGDVVISAVDVEDSPVDGRGGRDRCVPFRSAVIQPPARLTASRRRFVRRRSSGRP